MDLSIGASWRGPMMANAARDPYVRRSVDAKRVPPRWALAREGERKATTTGWREKFPGSVEIPVLFALNVARRAALARSGQAFLTQTVMRDDPTNQEEEGCRVHDIMTEPLQTRPRTMHAERRAVISSISRSIISFASRLSRRFKRTSGTANDGSARSS